MISLFRIANKVDLVLPSEVGPESVIAFSFIEASCRNSMVYSIVPSFSDIVDQLSIHFLKRSSNSCSRAIGITIPCNIKLASFPQTGYFLVVINSKFFVKCQDVAVSVSVCDHHEIFLIGMSRHILNK